MVSRQWRHLGARSGGSSQRSSRRHSRSAWHETLVSSRRRLRQENDIAAVMDKPKIEKAAFVTNDIGNMVGCAFAAQFPARGHFNFRGPDVERLVKGRASTSTGFGMNFPPIPKRSKRQRAVTMRGSMHSPVPCISARNQFAAFLQDASENKWPMAILQCAYWRSAAIIRSARNWPTSCAW